MVDQTTLEQPESLRDTVMNAVEAAETPIETPLESTETPVEATKTERVRDNEGKFAKASETAEIEQPVEVQAETKPRPSSWKKDYEEDWGKLDTRLQDYIQQREADYAKGVSTYKNQWDSAQPIVEAIRQFEPLLQQHNIRPDVWISNLGKAHAQLALGNPDQKLEMFAKLANDYGVNLGQLTGQQGYDPQFSQLAQELNQIKNQWTSFQSQQEQMEQAQLQSEISSFKNDKPYFEEVRETMAGLLQSGMASDLQSAYDKAVRLQDDVFQKIQATQAQSTEAARHEKLAQVKAKALSPKSASPTGTQASGGKGANSARDAVLAAFDMHSSGLI